MSVETLSEETPAPLLPESAPQPQTPESIPHAQKKILAIGSRQTLPEFLAFYILHLTHGEHLHCVYIDEFEGMSPPEQHAVSQAMLAEGYERVYVFNSTTPDLFGALARTDKLLLLSTTSPVQHVAPDKLGHTVQVHADQIVSINGKFHQIVQITRNQPERPVPLTSLVLQALYFTTTASEWYRGPSVKFMPLALSPRLTEEQNQHLRNVWELLEQLPGYANKEAVKLHEALEHHAIPRDFNVMDQYFGIGLA